MEVCVGCGSPIAPAWKYCIHCGIAIDRDEIPGAIRPEDAAAAKPSRARWWILGGIGVFLVGIALLVLALIYLTRAFA